MKHSANPMKTLQELCKECAPVGRFMFPNLMKLQFLGFNTHALTRANVKFSVEEPIYTVDLFSFAPHFTLSNA